MTNYTNCLSLKQVDYLELFDDLPYKYVKNLVKMDNETDFEVEIEDIVCDRVGWCETKFTFTISINDIDRTFEKVLYYNNSSPIALAIIELEYNEPSDESSDESSEESEEDNEESEDSEEDNEESEDSEEISEEISEELGEDIEDNILSRPQ